MKSLQTLMAGIDQRIKANAERAQAEQGALPFEAEPEAAPSIEDAADQVQPPKARAKSSHLVPHRHRQGDFFIADILDAIPKGDMASMEHPLFALKAGDMRVRTYERNGVTVTVKPGHDGCATIHDKDVWIYCISQLVEAMNRGREDVSRVVRFTAYDFLVTTNRRTDGDSYERMKDALDRLRGTSVNTDIETDGFREARGFGLVDSWRVVEEKARRMVAVEVTLPEWLWRSVKAKHVLTLSRDYFRIRKPLDRRIYELARKHCGAQPKWRVSIKTLYEKSGSTDALRKFRAAAKALAESNELPDYRMAFDAESDTLTFYARAEKGRVAQIADIKKTLAAPKRKAR
jgi:plasmid replication initiation protein